MSFLFAPAAGAAVSRAPQSATPPLNLSEKLSARQGRTRLRQFVSPAQPVLKKLPPRQERTRLRQFGYPIWSVQEIYTKKSCCAMQQLFRLLILIEQGRNRSFLVDTRDRLGEHRCNRQNVDLIQLLVVGQRDGIEDG